MEEYLVRYPRVREVTRRLVFTVVAITALLFAVGSLFYQVLPAHAACGGVTNVANETELNAAIVDFNSQGSACLYNITLSNDISLGASTTVISNTVAGVELTIDGANHAVDGLGVAGVRSFEIGPDTIVSMQAVTVTNGNVATVGGGIYSMGDLTLIATNVISNRSAGSGAGIYQVNGSVHISDSLIDNNLAEAFAGSVYGGGIHGDTAILTLIDTVVSNNDAGAPTLAAGAGIYGYRSDVTLTGVTISDNYVYSESDAGGAGVALEHGASSLLMSDTVVNNNTAVGPIGGSGGLYLDGMDGTMQVSISDSIIRDNSVDATTIIGAGGVLAKSTAFTMDGSTVSGNSADSDLDEVIGGGIVAISGSVTISNSVVSDNSVHNSATGDASAGGFAVYKGAAVTLVNTTVSGNSATTALGNVARAGAIVVYDVDSTLMLINSTISDNYVTGTVAVETAGVQVHVDGTLSAHNSILANNLANGIPGADCTIVTGTPDIQHTLIESTGVSACGLAAANPDVNGNIVGQDPSLGALQNNGGDTETHVLGVGSLAVDAGDDTLALDPINPLTTDQRGVGFPRILGTAVDMGAYESPPVVTQNIALASGWNMISIIVQPADPAVASVLAAIADDMILMKDDAGQVYWPAMVIDEIGDWAQVEGYQIFMDDAAVLAVNGRQVDPVVTPISLQTGWNTVAYLRNSAMAVETALAGIGSELHLAKSGAGEVYWPDYSVNQVGNMVPGQGYQIYMDNAANLTYPGNS